MRVKTKMKSLTAHGTPWLLMLANTESARSTSCLSRAHKQFIFLKHGRLRWKYAKLSADSQPLMIVFLNWKKTKRKEESDSLKTKFRIRIYLQELFVWRQSIIGEPIRREVLQLWRRQIDLIALLKHTKKKKIDFWNPKMKFDPNKFSLSPYALFICHRKWGHVTR